MADQRVSMFVSHKVASHKRAAERIREVLQSRTERLDVQICEEIGAGSDWLKWIKRHIAHSHIMLVILPHTDEDLRWIANEIGRFQAAVPRGHLIPLKRPSDPNSSILPNLQTIDSVKEVILEKFLEPLYRKKTFTGAAAPLNRRVSDTDIAHDAQEIADAVEGVLPMRHEAIGCSLLVETAELKPDVTEDLDRAQVTAVERFSEILNWQRRSFTWRELRERAAKDTGKGTFWVTEMQDVIMDALRQDRPRIMSSTFRGRGYMAGSIFRPVLDRIDYIESQPVRFSFVFHEVLVPELVRAKGTLGDVFNLLYIATRVKYEVLYPFLIKPWQNNHKLPSKWEMSKQEQRDLVRKVIGSLRVIDLQIERNDMINPVLSAFHGDDLQSMQQMLQERLRIMEWMERAAEQNDFEKVMETLKQALDLNCRVMEPLVGKFQELLTRDLADLQEMLHQTSPPLSGVMQARVSS